MPVVPLHEGILKDVPLENISYGQDPRDMVQNLQRGEYNAVFLLPPPDKDAFADVCQARRQASAAEIHLLLSQSHDRARHAVVGWRCFRPLISSHAGPGATG